MFSRDDIQDVLSVTSYIIVFDGENTRWTGDNWDRLRFYNRRYNDFWQRAILVVSKWHNDKYSEKRR